jgi:hypothetical protein
MTTEFKATRAVVTIGSLEVDGFMLPDGTYRMSQTQAAEMVGLTERNTRDFLRGKAVKSLLGEDYIPAKIEKITVETEGKYTGNPNINALPLDVVSVYWLYQALRGNKLAIPLCVALITETLERRFDHAFGVSRSEQERDQRLSDRLQRLQKDLDRLGEGFALDDLIRQERDRFEQKLIDHGIDPWD